MPRQSRRQEFMESQDFSEYWSSQGKKCLDMLQDVFIPTSQIPIANLKLKNVKQQSQKLLSEKEYNQLEK